MESLEMTLKWFAILKINCIQTTFHTDYEAIKQLGKGSFARVNYTPSAAFDSAATLRNAWPASSDNSATSSPPLLQASRHKALAADSLFAWRRPPRLISTCLLSFNFKRCTSRRGSKTLDKSRLRRSRKKKSRSKLIAYNFTDIFLSHLITLTSGPRALSKGVGVSSRLQEVPSAGCAKYQILLHSLHASAQTNLLTSFTHRYQYKRKLSCSEPSIIQVKLREVELQALLSVHARVIRNDHLCCNFAKGEYSTHSFTFACLLAQESSS